MPLNLNSTLGQYRIDELIGEGGFATVYKGYQPSLERPVAIKVLSEQLSHKTNFIERFRREAEATFSLKHPNIVEVYDFQEIDGNTFMVMEYVEGPSLRDVLMGKGAFDARTGEEDATRLRDEIDGTRLREDEADLTVMKHLTGRYEPLSVGLVAQIAEHVCAALTYAHKQGVVHRDMKPDNVLISKDGRALLTDFGIARVQEESRLTRTGATMGTWAYMSPEQFSKPKEVNSRTDIYSLGVMLYELLTGSVPFVGVDTAVLQKHLSEKPLKPRTLRGDIPVAMEKVVMKCLEKSPEKRYQTTEEVAQAILAKTKPIPLTALFGTGADKSASKKEKDGSPEMVCLQCGYGFSQDGEPVVCPACGNEMIRIIAEQQIQDRLKGAREFIEGYNFDRGLSMDVRAFLYRKTLKPDLLRKYGEMLKEWETSLDKGSVVPPTLPEEDQPDRKNSLATAKKLLEFNAMWDAPALNEYVVELEERRERKKRIGSLEARAFQVLGLFHSLEAAEAQTNQQMVSQYELARMWVEHSEEILKDCEPDLAPATGFSRQFLDVILQFPKSPQGMIPEISIQPDLAPGLRADLTQYHAYEGILEKVQGQIYNLKGAARNLLDKVKDQIETIKQRLLDYKKEEGVQEQHHLKQIAYIQEKFESETAQLQTILQVTRWTIFLTPWVAGLIGLIMAGSMIDYIAGPAFGLMALALSLGILYVKLPNRPEKLNWWDVGPMGAGVLGLLMTNFLVGVFVAGAGSLGLWLVGYRWPTVNRQGGLGKLILLVVVGSPLIFSFFYPLVYHYGLELLLKGEFFAFLAGMIIGGVYRSQKPKLDSAHSRLQDTLMQEDAAHQNKLNEIASNRFEKLNQFKFSTDADIKAALDKLVEAELHAHKLSLRLLREKTTPELAQTDELRSYMENLNRDRSQYITADKIPAPKDFDKEKGSTFTPIPPVSQNNLTSTSKYYGFPEKSKPSHVRNINIDASASWKFLDQTYANSIKDAVLNGEILLHGGVPLDKVHHLSKKYFSMECDYWVEAGSHKKLNFSRRMIPTSLTLKFKHYDNGDIKIELHGRILPNVEIVDQNWDLDSLNREIKGYLAALSAIV